MKISSVSKKVLCTALSAATALAFTPAVALATPSNVDPAKYVTVTYDANGSDVTAKPSDTLQLQEENGKYYLKVTETYAGTSNGYNFSKWFIDADGDGILDNGEKYVDREYVEVSANTTDVTLKAAFDSPAISAGTFAPGDPEDYEEGAHGSIAFSVGEGKVGHEYLLTVEAPDGTTVGERAFGGTNGVAVTDMDNPNYTTVAFKNNPTSTNKMEAYSSFLGSGTYTATLTEGGKVISTCNVELASLTVKDGINAVADDDVVSLWQLEDGEAEARVDLGPGVYLVDGNGYAVDATAIAMKGDTVVYTTDTVQVPSAFAYDNTDRTATVTLTDTTAEKGDSYAVSVAGPDGSAVYSATVKAVGEGSIADPTVTFSFDQSATSARANQAESAGTYTVTVAKTAKADGTVTTSKKDMVLSEVVYDLGDGKVGEDVITDSFTDGAKATLANFGSLGTAPKGYEFSGWSFGDESYKAGDEVDLEAGEVNTITAEYKALSYASTPTCTVSEVAVGASTEYYMTITGTATGETVTYSIEDGSQDQTYDGPFKLTPGKDVTVKVSANGKTDVVVEYEDVTGTVESWDDFTSGGSSVFELTIGNSGTKWLAADGVKAAIESGKASYTALAEKLWATSDELTDTYNATFKALYEAVKAEADAQIAAYADEAVVAAGEKSYTMDARTYAAAQKLVADVEKEVSAAEKGDEANAEFYGLYASKVINAANEALKSAVETKATRTDVEAAAAVDAQIAALPAVSEASTDEELEAAAEAADNAVADYAALTAEGKKLVEGDITSAFQLKVDVLTIQAKRAADKAASELAQKQKELEEAKEALIAEQDHASALQVKGKTKTVKAAKWTYKSGKWSKVTKKAKSVKIVAEQSPSGAKATFKTVSKASKIKINGAKVTLKKGAVKGKTYKAKVQVKYGNASNTVTVKFKVK